MGVLTQVTMKWKLNTFGFPQKKEKIYAHTEVLFMKLKA